jgi:competence protein ComEA
MGWVLALCLGLALSPVLAEVQKDKAPSAERINLNKATMEQLQTLPGVGPALAKRILEHRQKSGKFKRIEEILNIKGMGEKKFQKIKDRLVV